MRIFSLGIDQLTNNEIKLAGFTVIAQSVLPEPEHAGGHLLMVTSEQVPVAELRELRGRYPDSSILYIYLQKKGCGVTRPYICSVRVWAYFFHASALHLSGNHR
ncbi:hypothetical protein ACFSQ7_42630 [Paenibacillus rhizoplanae]